MDEAERWAARILLLLAQREADASVCPSEVARAHGGARWREHMDDVRAAARALAARGEIVITQKGVPVDASVARGPIRLRRA